MKPFFYFPEIVFRDEESVVLFDVIDVLGEKKGLHQCPKLSTTSVIGLFVLC